MKVKEIMTSPAITIGADAPFKEIVETMARHGVSGLPVVDAEGTLAGIVTEADLLLKEAFPRREGRKITRLLQDVIAGTPSEWLKKAAATVASELMVERVRTVGPDEDVRAASRRLLEGGIKRMPVVEDGVVVGMVSRADLLRVFARSDASVRVSIEGLLRRCAYVEPDYAIDVSVLDGVATLRGSVLFRSDMRVAEALVAGVPGVVGVTNLLTFLEEDPKRPSAWPMEEARLGRLEPLRRPAGRSR